MGQWCCVWRYFERLIVGRGVRDDLVQLFGYYQYPFQFSLAVERLDGKPATPMQRFIEAVADGRIAQRTQSEGDLRESLGLTGGELKAILLEARSSGIDIRTRKTNPRIPEGSVLIPYPFPTLNSQSVTGRKQIF